MNEHLYSTVRSQPINEQVRSLQLMIKYENRKKQKLIWEQKLSEAMKEQEIMQLLTESASFQIPVRTKKGVQRQNFIFISTRYLLAYYKNKAKKFNRNYPILN